MLGEISVPFLAPFKLSLMTESKEDVEVETLDVVRIWEYLFLYFQVYCRICRSLLAIGAWYVFFFFFFFSFSFDGLVLL